MMRSMLRLAACASLIVVVTAETGTSQEGPKATGVVAVRQASMQSLGGHTGAIQKTLTEYPQLIALVPLHAQAIASLAPEVPKMFPAGSTQEPTAALPVIWEKQDEFAAAAKKVQELAMKVAETARGGDVQATLAAFSTMGKDGCGGCHNTFREKKS
jgi:cytochrome c556